MDFRFAQRTDVPMILTFIKELADYEQMLDQVVATEEMLEHWLFDKQKAEVIFVLLHYCADISRGNNGAERKPTMNFIERQAYAWANLGISTMEAAEEYAEKEKSLQSDLGRVKSLLEIYDRKLTPTESNNIKAWLSMGFSDDAIELAYHRTVDKTGKRSLPYMNSILLRWHEAGIHTAREVEAAEPSARPAPGRGNKSHGAHGPFVPTEF